MNDLAGSTHLTLGFEGLIIHLQMSLISFESQFLSLQKSWRKGVSYFPSLS
jgi:hypothetical protein